MTLTPAEKQSRYRDRKRQSVTGNAPVTDSEAKVTVSPETVTLGNAASRISPQATEYLNFLAKRDAGRNLEREIKGIPEARLCWCCRRARADPTFSHRNGRYCCFECLTYASYILGKYGNE